MKTIAVGVLIAVLGVVASGFYAWCIFELGYPIWGFALWGAWPGLMFLALTRKTFWVRTITTCLIFGSALAGFGFLFDSYVFGAITRERLVDNVTFFFMGCGFGALLSAIVSVLDDSFKPHAVS